MVDDIVLIVGPFGETFRILPCPALFAISAHLVQVPLKLIRVYILKNTELDFTMMAIE